MRSIKAIVLLAVISSCLYWADAAAASGKIELPDQAVFKKVFENGLVLLVKERPPRNLAAIDIAVKAGSSLEGEYAGSGIAHFVEHMVFKGTSAKRAGDIDKEVKSYGGFINADSSQDVTHFRAIIPSEHFEKALSVLKDMLLGATFEKGQFEREREVIIKEINLETDEPISRLMRALNDTAYLEHPYKLPVIGCVERFKILKRDDLASYYRRMYVPNRIVIAIAGGVDAKRAAEAVEKEFKYFRPANYAPAGPCVREMRQTGKRTREEHMAINLAYLACGFHSTSIFDKDLFAMDVLTMILGRGDNSRLQRALVKEKRLVHSISAWNYTPRDPGLLVITAVLDEGKIDRAEEAVMEEIDKIRTGAVKPGEVEAAKRMVLADFIFSMESVEDDARNLSEDEALAGDHSFSRRYVQGIQAVTADEIKKAAEIYLTENNLTSVRLLPGGAESGRMKQTAHPAAVEEGVAKRRILPNGLKVIVRQDRKTPTVSITVAIAGGLLAEERTNNGISSLAARMLLKGTAKRREADIKGAIENAGGSIEPFSGFDSFGIGIEVMRPDLDNALEILKDVLANPACPEDLLEGEKALVEAAIREEEDDIFAKGSYILKKELFENHPYAMRQIGEIGTVKGLKRQDILDFYARHVASDNMAISVSGDIEPDAVFDRIGSLFREMKPARPAAPVSAAPSMAQAKTRTLEMPRDESLVMIGFLTVGVKDRDRYALDVLGSILSGDSGRLFSELREEQSLAYTLGCAQRLGLDSGCMVLYAATTQDKVNQTKNEIIREIKKTRSSLVGDEELESAKHELMTGHDIAMQANGFFSIESALNEIYGLGYEAVYGYKDAIASVTKEDVKTVAAKYLDPERRAEVIISPK